MTARSLVRRALLVLAAPALLAVVAVPAAAQEKGNGKGDGAAAKPVSRASSGRSDAKAAVATPAKAKPAAPARARAAAPPAKAKKRVTHVEAVDVSRSVLIERGYTVTRVERVGDTRVIYYYRGNNGRGKGRGPLQRMVVRPSADRFVFDGAPADVKRAVMLRLQF
jgi:hypothetical protein